MTGRRRSVFVVMLALGIALVAVAPSASGATKKNDIVLRVGTTQDIDSPNPTVGALVSSYEVWALQYATLTDKAAADFKTIPGLAESWTASNHGLTYTYTLRKGLKWSDGQPLTADDVVYTVNRARSEQWTNFDSTIAHITAKVIDPTHLSLTSSIPDPKLPIMDVYIVPKHIYEKVTKKGLASYKGLDGIGSGPFTLKHWSKGLSWEMDANPNYWRGRPAVDRVIFRPFTNADAMVAALKNGELDAAENVPSSSFRQLQKAKNIVGVAGQQGGFDEISMNSGAGVGGNPALKDLRVRQAISHAIDKQTIESRVYNGLTTVADAISPSANPEWIPKIPADKRFNFDLAKANTILDDAGYKDTNGNGIRNMPKGGADITLRYAERSESPYGAPIREFVTGWLRKIGIGTSVKVYNDTQLTPAIGKGDVDMFAWGWVPFVDPDPELSYFQCNQVPTKADPSGYSNDASWCNPTYDKLYKQQNTELDHAKRVAIVHQMITLMYEQAPYVVLDYSPDFQAYRTDRFTGWVKQPANIGPVIFSNTSPSYFLLKPISKASSGGGLGAGAVIAIIVGAVIILGGGGLLLRRRQATAGERE
ncbi:MAG: transporter substrate-binding protein [Actinomycetia bacterium]|nr:transporter substrate-binding protein [Actinomycetes bacterium]